MVTMAPSPFVRNHVKTWRGHGIHRQNNYWRKAGVSVCWFDATNYIKTHIHLKNIFLSACDQLSAALRTSHYKLKNELIPCCGDHSPRCDVGRSHSHNNLKPLEADGRGGVMVSVLFWVCVQLVVCCVVHEGTLYCTYLRRTWSWFLRCCTIGLTGFEINFHT
jgi:hypothetical protein